MRAWVWHRALFGQRGTVQTGRICQSDFKARKRNEIADVFVKKRTERIESVKTVIFEKDLRKLFLLSCHQHKTERGVPNGHIGDRKSKKVL